MTTKTFCEGADRQVGRTPLFLGEVNEICKQILWSNMLIIIKDQIVQNSFESNKIS